MSNLRKAAEELIEAWDWDCSEPRNKVLRDLIEDIRQALAQPKQEPVAWRNMETGEFCTGGFLRKDLAKWTPLYTAPPISDYHEGWEEGFKAATREQEPFIYVREVDEKLFGGYEHCSEADAGAFPVYTAPPKREWVGLTDEDLSVFTTEFYNGAVWAEAKLKEKNT